MTKFYYLSVFFLFIFLGNSFAQPKCGSQRLHENRLYNEPEYAKSWEQFQRQRIEWMNQAQSRTDGTNCQGGIKTIPVAIHYDYNPANATERTCLINLANSQIAHLNQAYTGQLCMEASGTTSSSGGCLNFVIANQNHPAGSGLMDGQPAILFGGNACPNGQDARNPNQPDYNLCALPAWKGYLNIVVKAPIPNQTLGIASTGNASTLDLPAQGTVNTMIISSCAFGVGTTNCAPDFPGSMNCTTNYATNIGGTTVTHELGHFFGLPHTFCSDQNGNPSNSGITGQLPDCPTNNCDCDGFADTPPQAYAEHTTPCDSPNGVLPNPITGANYSYNNFMDYVDDRCMTCFSTMQANQIRNRARHPDNNVKANVFRDGNPQTCQDGSQLRVQGTNCNDNNANTINDVIQADGCTCAGTPAMPMNLCGDNTPKMPPGTPCGANNAGRIDADSCACVAVTSPPMNLCGDNTPKMTPGTPCGANNAGRIDADSCACVAVTPPPMNLCPDGFPKAAPGTDCSDGGPAAQIGADSCSCFFVDDGAPPIAGDGGESWCVDEARFAGGEGQIILSNLITEREIIQIIGAGTNWQEITICDGDCADNQVISDLAAGSYQVKLQMFESSDNSYCYREETLVVTGETGDSGGGEALDCNNVLINSTGNQIDVNNLAPVSIVKVYLVQPNGGWELKGSCNGNCGDTKTFSNLPDGNYIVAIEFFNANYNDKICDTQVGMIIGSGLENCPNGTLKSNPGTACNDGNANTVNDRIQADGCTCQGEMAPSGATSCDNITIVAANGRIKVAGLNAPIAQVKLYKVKNGGGWELVNRCNGDCGNEQTFTGLAAGSYIIDVVLYSANYTTRICGLNQIVALGSTLNSQAGSRSVQLLEFAAYKNNRTVDLQWLTNTSYKNVQYILEKSTNGTDFEPLKTIQNNSHDLAIQSFKEVDSNPKMGINYYRLKQQYQDGSFDYTPIQQVQFDWDVQDISVFPNPAKSVIHINLTKYINKKATIQIMDGLGKQYLEQPIEKLSGGILQIPIHQLDNGLYYLVIKVGNQPAFTRKVVVNQWY